MNRFIKKYSFLALSLVLAACSNTETAQEEVQPENETLVTLSPTQEQNIGLQLDTLIEKQIASTLRLNGIIDVPPQNLISVSIAMGGYLKSTKMLPGTYINKGDILAAMEDQQYIQLQQDYLVAQTKLNYARQEFNRQKELNTSKASSDKILQQADTERKNLSIELFALAEKLRLIGINPNNLKESTISKTIYLRSPINGYISKVNANVGKYIAPTDVIFELVNPQDIHLNLNVFEKDLDKIAIGKKVWAYTNANPEKRYETEVILISKNISAERNTEVHCHFEKYDKTLIPGMYMNAEIELESQMTNVLPEQAVVSFENKPYVFIEKQKHSYELTPVEIGATENGDIAIYTALKGQKIVTKGAYSLLMQLKNKVEDE